MPIYGHNCDTEPGGRTDRGARNAEVAGIFCSGARPRQRSNGQQGRAKEEILPCGNGGLWISYARFCWGFFLLVVWVSCPWRGWSLRWSRWTVPAVEPACAAAGVVVVRVVVMALWRWGLWWLGQTSPDIARRNLQGISRENQDRLQARGPGRGYTSCHVLNAATRGDHEDEIRFALCLGRYDVDGGSRSATGDDTDSRKYDFRASPTGPCRSVGRRDESMPRRPAARVPHLGRFLSHWGRVGWGISPSSGEFSPPEPNSASCGIVRAWCAT